jgi:F420-dependent oxidoreductase-like protein
MSARGGRGSIPRSGSPLRVAFAAVRVCLMIEGQEDVTWEQWLALARACEEQGIEALFRSDHYSSVMGERFEDRGSLDAWATLNALAARTETLRLGTLVSPATFRHPSELAKVVTAASHVSDGRVELGLGAGWHEREHRAYGFDFFDLRTRLARFAEQLEIVHRSWTEDEFDFDGEHYRLERCRALPKPVSKPNLIVGGAAKRGTAEPAVRFADEYNTTFASVEDCRDRRRRLDEACERAGRDPSSLTYSLMTGCCVGADRDDLLDRARRIMEVRGDHGDPAAWLEEQSDTWVTGTADEAGERLRQLEGVGVERVMLQNLTHDDLRHVELIASLA